MVASVPVAKYGWHLLRTATPSRRRLTKGSLVQLRRRTELVPRLPQRARTAPIQLELETSRDSQATNSSCNAQSADNETLRDADLETGAIDRVELPRRQNRHDTGRQLHVYELTRCAPLALNATHTPPAQRMPAIMDDDNLPDMGRMTARLRWGESRGSSPVPIGADRAAAMTTLIMTAKLNDVDPQAWLADVLGQIADIPQGRLPNYRRGIGSNQICERPLDL